MKDRFNLEQEIMQIKNYSEDIRMVVENLINNQYDSSNIDVDKCCNVLEGVATLLDMHSDKMFDTMSQCFKIDHYRKAVLQDAL